ncbi:MAG: EAL domain-containing protein, partial [Cyanobacteria bacterium P01_C01_bin.121]
ERYGALFTSSPKLLMNTHSSVADNSYAAPTDAPKVEKIAAPPKTASSLTVSPVLEKEILKKEATTQENAKAAVSCQPKQMVAQQTTYKEAPKHEPAAKTKEADAGRSDTGRTDTERTDAGAAKVEGFSSATPPPATQDSLNTKTLKQIFQLSPIGMTILDLSGGFLSANQSFCDAVGYTERELIMLTFTDLTHPEDVPLLRSLGEQLLEGERQHFQVETRHWSKDEKPLHVGLTVTMVRDGHQRPICFLLQVVNLTEQKWMEAQLRHRDFYDALTGLANRALFVNRVEQAVIRLERNASHQCAVLFLDLDRFKVINDSLGHTIGDQLLSALAGRLESCIRRCDTLARLGGDEFAILLEEIDGLDDALAVCDRIHDSLKTPFKLSNYEVFANISIGLVCSSVGYEKSSDLLRNADTALYRAKGQGGACHTVFDQTMHQRAVALWQMATQAQFAVQREELKLRYQPVIDISTGRVVGVEALIRWHHPQHGSISPSEFIPVMEETGVITLIGQWVLREACQKVKTWQDLLPASCPIKINVNLSARQLAQADLAKQVAQILAETGLPAQSLRLEITETAIMHNSKEAIEVLKQLRLLKVGLCIDDFGIGYSSLSRLQQLPIDILKIDRSFVQNIGARGENTEIVRTIIDLADNLGMDIVAEGVETQEQLEGLRALGCQNVQGFYFARPMTPEDALRFIQESNL